ncbi:MAG: hypothetical protein U0835_19985 [Isosphaeraceae bacterium]
MNGPDGVGPNAAGNVVSNNKIGTNSAGTAAVGNVFGGVFLVFGAPNNRFNGNVISGNGQSGVVLSGPGARGNVFAGNLIGVNAAGTGPLANVLSGVFLDNAGGNTIGLPGQGNVIAASPSTGSGASATGGAAVQISGAGGAGNVVQSNRINLSVAGRPIFPGGTGVFLNRAGSNTVPTRGANANLFGVPGPFQVVTVDATGQTRVTRSAASLARPRRASVTVG